MLSIHLRLGLPSGLFPSGFPTNNLYTFLFSPIRAACPAHLILLDFTFMTSDSYVAAANGVGHFVVAQMLLNQQEVFI
jgi:hypothetical protein